MQKKLSYLTVAGLLSGLVLLLLLLFADDGHSSEPEKVHFIKRSGFKGLTWYRTQATLWESEIERDPTSAAAWMNYYIATEYSYWGNVVAQAEKKNRLATILDRAAAHISNSYEYNLLRHRQDNSNRSALEKAYSLRPENPDTYYGFILQHEVSRDTANLRRFNLKLYNSADISPGLLNYNYNMLMSTDENAILFTNGDNDTYPAWMLQQAQNIRPDVTVLNISISRGFDGYLQQRLQERGITLDLASLPNRSDQQFFPALCEQLSQNHPALPIFFAVTVHPSVLKSFSDSLFNEGLAYRYQASKYDNAAALQKNWEGRFRLDYLKNQWYSEKYLSTGIIEKQLNGNYIAAMMILMSYYQQEKMPGKAVGIENFAREIAQKSGKEADLENYLKRIQSK